MRIKNKINIKKISMIATLSAIASVLRIPFAVIPSLQPTSFIVAVSGYVFGIRAGITVGMLSAVISNMFLGQGLWTAMQMVAWGLIGLTYGVLGKLTKDYTKATKRIFIVVLFLWGYFYGWIMNIWHWLTVSTELNFGTFIGVNIASFTFDTTHALGNFLFALLFGKDFITILKRYKRKVDYKRITINNN